jgi:hypothetical protein
MKIRTHTDTEGRPRHNTGGSGTSISQEERSHRYLDLRLADYRNVR